MLSSRAGKSRFLMAEAWTPDVKRTFETEFPEDEGQGQETWLTCARCQMSGWYTGGILESARKWEMAQSRLVDWSLSTSRSKF